MLLPQNRSAISISGADRFIRKGAGVYFLSWNRVRWISQSLPGDSAPRRKKRNGGREISLQNLLSCAILSKSVPLQGWYIGITAASQAVKAGSTPVPCSSSKIPTTVPFPPCGENCTLVGISSLSARIRFAGFRAEKDGGCGLWPASFLSTRDSSPQASYFLRRRFYAPHQKLISRSFCCSSPGGAGAALCSGSILAEGQSHKTDRRGKQFPTPVRFIPLYL